MQAIVDFMYKGEISVGHEQLASLMNAAESLQVATSALIQKVVPSGVVEEGNNPPTPHSKKCRNFFYMLLENTDCVPWFFFGKMLGKTTHPLPTFLSSYATGSA